MFTAVGTSWLLVIVVVLFGAIVGSFLNVVIHRLPRGRSIRHPARSCCPVCGVGIRWYHNVPLLSWLRLRGRCYDCGTAIAVRYPLVEAATALVFLFIWDQYFVGGAWAARAEFASDWPMLVACMGLFAALIASAAIDIESYTIDIRVCIFAMLLGIVASSLHGLSAGDPTSSIGVRLHPLPPALCLIGVAMGGTWLMTFIVVEVFVRRQGDGADTASLPQPVAGDNDPSDETDTTGVEMPSAPASSLVRAGVCALTLFISAFAVWLIVAADRPSGMSLDAGAIRALLVCAVMMLLLILAGLAPRAVDHEVYQEIEDSRPQARRVALGELLWLMPALAVGITVFLWLRRTDQLAMSWPQVFERYDSAHLLIRHGGAAGAAVAALVWASAAGWGVRILGTLAFGKEAYGTGDIYIMAAIAASAGIWNCLFGFFLAALLALTGTIVMLLRKRSRAIPFGPWLALGSLCALPLEPGLLRFFRPAGEMLWALLTGQSF